MAGVGLISCDAVRLVGETSLIPPMAIPIMCVLAGIGTLLLLPMASARRSHTSRFVGMLLLGFGMLTLAVIAICAVFGGPLPGIGPYFWIFSVIAVIGAIRVITHPRPVYSALYFVLTVFASGGLFILLSADFLAAALILIYAGAILITYVFVIMLAAQATGDAGRSALSGLAEYDLNSREPLAATCVGFILLGLMTFLLFYRADGLTYPQPLHDSASGQIVAPAVLTGQTQALGEYLFRHQLVNVELAGLILTLSMIGAIVIARRKIVDAPGLESGGEPEEVLGPATPINDDPHSIPVDGTFNPAQKAYPET